MGVSNLGEKVAADDMNTLRETRNPPEYAEGFSPSDDAFDSLFSDEADPFTASGGAPSAGPGQPTMGGSPFGAQPIMGGFGQPQPQQPAPPPKPDLLDTAMEASGVATMAIGRIMMTAFSNMRNRTADDWGFYSRNLMLGGIVTSGVSVILTVVGIASGIQALKFSHMPIQLLFTGVFMLGAGLIGLGSAALALVRGANSMKDSEIKDIAGASGVETEPELKEKASELLKNLFDVSDESYEDDYDDNSYFGEDIEYEPSFKDEPEIENMSADEVLESIPSSVPMISRAFLLDTFSRFLPKNSPNFDKEIEIDKDDEQFNIIETLALKAIAAAAKMEYEDVIEKIHMESAVETFFTFNLKIDRLRGLTKLSDIEREMIAYFRDSADDNTVSCVVDLERSSYRVLIGKGVKTIVTVGDILAGKEAYNFFKDEKNKLPVIAGLTETGKPILVDAKNFDTMLIAGKPRSGKSWYILSLILPMIMFNPPEDVQFLIIDPKESVLFKTVALLPHVCGLHNDSNILKVLNDIIEKEGARRKKLLDDNRCETIWGLKKKGHNEPILYIVIDEIMTVVANLADPKEFFRMIKIIVSQLPSQGIRLIMVPHRSQGVVDKTIRTNMSFTAAVRADQEVIMETLDIKRWERLLINQGDIALKMQGEGKEMYVKSSAISTSDDDNTEIIETIARALYKMGVDVPDMRSIGAGYNRNMEVIKEELGVQGNCKHEQFDINDTSNIDLGQLD